MVTGSSSPPCLLSSSKGADSGSSSYAGFSVRAKFDQLQMLGKTRMEACLDKAPAFALQTAVWEQLVSCTQCAR